MKVFVVGPEKSDCFTHNVAHAFRSLGHEVFSMPPHLFATVQSRVSRGLEEILQRTSSTWRLRGDRWAIRVAGEFKPAITFVCTRTLEPETVEEIRKRSGGLVICWYGDTPGNIRRDHIVSGEYDAVFLKDTDFARSCHDVLGIEAYTLDEACNPDWHRPMTKTRSHHLLAAGTLYGYRNSFLKRLADQGEMIQVYGPPPSPWVPQVVKKLHTGRYLDQTTKAQAFNEALACLNTFAPAERNNLNCRIFETCASGGLLLTERKEALSRCFEPGKEYLDFASFEECIEQIDRIRFDIGLSERIRQAAVKKAHGEHTYVHRLATILRTIDVSLRKS